MHPAIRIKHYAGIYNYVSKWYLLFGGTVYSTFSEISKSRESVGVHECVHTHTQYANILRLYPKIIEVISVSSGLVELWVIFCAFL